MAQGGVEHVLELLLARRRHHDHAGDETQVREVEGAVVRRAVVADKTGPIDREHDRDLLQAHVLHEHVEGALQEGGVDGDDRPHAAERHAGGEDDGMLLGDADVEEARGNSCSNGSRPVPSLIAAVTATTRGSSRALAHQRVAESLRVGRTRVAITLPSAVDDMERVRCRGTCRALLRPARIPCP